MSPASDPRAAPLLLLFLDGVGVGPDDPEVNPFLRASLPHLRHLLGGGLPTLNGVAPGAVIRPAMAPEFQVRPAPLDATLGVEGLPQSGTGQVTLLTGVNAARHFGRHFGPWPPTSLRRLLASENLLVQGAARGARVTFANAYPAGWPGTLPTRRHAAPPLAALAAGVLDRHLEDLVEGRAVASEIVNDGWIRYTGRKDLPRVSAIAAGRTLARLAREHDLTLFAHYTTDEAGHRGGMEGGVTALERVDAFLGGIVEEARKATRGPGEEGLHLVVVSDHGNVEDVRGGHTRNPALALEVQVGGPGRPPRPWALEGATDLTGIAPGVLRCLGG